MLSRRLVPLFLLTLTAGCGTTETGNASQTFSFEMNFSYPGDPVFVYDHLTGDISDWWDHSFAENPEKLFIEARPGGGFYEIFDKQGNGALHATVNPPQRGCAFPGTCPWNQFPESKFRIPLSGPESEI